MVMGTKSERNIQKKSVNLQIHVLAFYIGTRGKIMSDLIVSDKVNSEDMLFLSVLIKIFRLIVRQAGYRPSMGKI